ncbi:MAG: septum formation protein Maf [Bacteroidota bacterium]|jgi:septum formation protein
MREIILASGSPRRKMLLEWAEVKFTVQVADCEEIVNPELKPEEVAVEIARIKLTAVRSVLSSHQSHAVLIAADTIVVLDNEIIGKPANRSHAIEILNKLAGKTHRVISGVCIADLDKTVEFYEETFVRFHPLTLAQITHYIDTYAPYDKAGSYAIQEWIGVVGIHSIQGDFYNVMGLPVSRVIKKIEEDFHWKD